MIKRNQIRINSSNKRSLLSENEFEDEADSSSTNNATHSPCKNVTKIITLNSGFRFATKLQDIKNDRTQCSNTKNIQPQTQSGGLGSTNEAANMLP